MDVRIAYGISLDDVPEKIATMIGDLRVVEVEQILDIVSRLIELSDDNVSVAIDLLDQARLRLSSLDRSITDCQMMLKGYESTKKTDEVEVKEEPVNAD